MRKILIIISLFALTLSCNNSKQKEEQKELPPPGNMQPASPEELERQAMAEAAAQPKENPYKNSKLEVKTFKDSSGWGYDIFIDGKQYIHQPHIPGVAGINGFLSTEKAKKAGEFVAYKIGNNIMPPSVTQQELDSLGVLK